MNTKPTLLKMHTNILDGDNKAIRAEIPDGMNTSNKEIDKKVKKG